MASPNADAASRRAPSNATASSAGCSTSRMPLPPPPAEALTSSGKPMPSAIDAQRAVDLAVQPRAGQDRDARALHAVARLGLRAHGGDRLGRRADPGQPGVDHGLREGGVLGQEAVAGMDRVGAGARARRRGSRRREGRTRPGWSRRAGSRRPPRPRRRRRRRGPSRRRRWRCRAGGRWRTPGARSRRDWRRARA